MSQAGSRCCTRPYVAHVCNVKCEVRICVMKGLQPCQFIPAYNDLAVLGKFMAELPLLQEQFTQKWQLSHYQLIPMPMECWVRFLNPQNMSGASQENSISAFSWTTKVDFHCSCEAAKLKMNLNSEAFSLLKNVSNFLSTQPVISGFLESWITPDNLYRATLFILLLLF